LVQSSRRREHIGRWLSVAASLALLAVGGCAALYTVDPRYGRGSAGTTTSPKAVADKRKGTLPWPVQGQVITQFGSVVNPKYGTTTKSTGIDILTRNGSPVAAVDSGIVSFADIFMGYGRMVIIDHGGRIHSIYSRLDDVKVKLGAPVARGQTIALSGDTLHFEFRVGGKSVDPLEWLVPR
jgi:septal ring factor EnvC (AmiA/AmiB activator)